MSSPTVVDDRSLADELKRAGASATVIAADLTLPGAAANLIRKIEALGLAIDGLINNAGVGVNGRFDQSDPVPSR